MSPVENVSVISGSELVPKDERYYADSRLHPNDEGHSLVAGVIIHFLELVYTNLEHEREQETAMPKPLTANTYEHSYRYQNDNSNPLNDGFVADFTPQNDIRDIFRKGWTSSQKGATLTFEVQGRSIAVQYRKSVIQPTPNHIVGVSSPVRGLFAFF